MKKLTLELIHVKFLILILGSYSVAHGATNSTQNINQNINVGNATTACLKNYAPKSFEDKLTNLMSISQPDLSKVSSVKKVSLNLKSSSNKNLVQPWLDETYAFSRNFLPSMFLKNGMLPAALDTRYQFFWVRDGSYVYNAYLHEYGEASWPQILNFAGVTAIHQQQKTFAEATNGFAYGNTQAKFSLSNGIGVSDWIPQGDGPGLRATLLMRFSYEMLRKAQITQNTQESQELLKNIKTMYDSLSNSRSVIKFDLESLNRLTKLQTPVLLAPNGEIWEEDWGRHLNPRLINRTALLIASVFAQNEVINDPSSSDLYLNLARQTKTELEKHWRDAKLWTTLEKDKLFGEDPRQRDYKISKLDTQVIMAGNYVSTNYLLFKKLLESHDLFSPDKNHLEALQEDFKFLSVTDPRMQTTMMALREGFINAYPINADSKKDNTIEPAVGRYFEDQYNANGDDIPNDGNPWVLTTQNFAKFLALNIIESWNEKSITISSDGINLSFYQHALEMLKRGDSAISLRPGQTIFISDPLFTQILLGLRESMYAYLVRLKRHTYQKEKNGVPDPNYLHMNEQFHRTTGFMGSVADLEWNYAEQLQLKWLLSEVETIINIL